MRRTTRFPGAAALLFCAAIICLAAQHATPADDQTATTQAAASQAPASTSPASRPADAPRPFQTGVSIDWNAPAVIVDAVVVRRDGPLEFLAAPPGKEHESILLLRARPQHIVMALGLIGLNTGRPPRWDDARQGWLPADGDLLDISLRWATPQGDLREQNAWFWMREFEFDRVALPRPWVLAGGLARRRALPPAARSGEGIAIVGFPDSVICPTRVFSERNDDLWAMACRDAIPAEGTPVQILLRAAAPLELRVRIDALGVAEAAGRSTDAADLADLLDIVRRQRPDAVVDIQLDGTLRADERRWEAALRALGATNWRMVRGTAPGSSAAGAER